MIVLDASAALELVLGTAAGDAVAERIRPPRETLHAPHLIDVEVAQVLRRYDRDRIVPRARASAALGAMQDLDVTRYEHDVLLPRVWALRGHVTAYDAVYLALAEALDAPLLTRDRRLARARGHHARVDVVTD